MTSPKIQAARTEHAIAPGKFKYRRNGNTFQVYLRQSATGTPAGGSASETLLRRIRSRHRRLDWWPAFFFGGVIWAAILAWQGSDLRTIASAILLALGATAAVAAVDRHRGNITICFDLDPLAAEAHRVAYAIFERLRQEKSGGVGWCESRPQGIFRVRFNGPPPAWMRTNLVVPSLFLDDRVLYFLPDRLLVLSGHGVQSVNYRSLHLERRLHFPPSSAMPREILELSMEGGSRNAYLCAFADPGTLQAMETALHALKDGQFPAPRPLQRPHVPVSAVEEAKTEGFLYPGAV